MQYSQRDPNRDHTRGRIYRLVYPESSAGDTGHAVRQACSEILEQLREYEWRTRYRARRELHDRPSAEVLPAVECVGERPEEDDPEYDRLRTEALWIQQSHHSLMVIACRLCWPESTSSDARAAAVRIVADERESFRKPRRC
jgi:hypothetical protein